MIYLFPYLVNAKSGVFCNYQYLSHFFDSFGTVEKFFETHIVYIIFSPAQNFSKICLQTEFQQDLYKNY